MGDCIIVWTLLFTFLLGFFFLRWIFVYYFFEFEFESVNLFGINSLFVENILICGLNYNFFFYCYTGFV